MNLQQYNVSENNFEQCIKCTVCTVYCPVVPINSNFPGPKHAGPDSERFRLKDPGFYDQSLKYCLNCKRCEIACPSGVKIGDIIQSARIKYNKSYPKLRDVLLANTDLVGSISSPIAPVVNWTLKLNVVKSLMDSVLKIDSHRMFPNYSTQTFEAWYKKYGQDEQKKFSNQVCYFHGCYVNYNYPQLGKDLIKIMNAAGYGVLLLKNEKCCGVPLISNGLITQATHQGQHNTDIIREVVVNKNLTVLGTSSSCIFTLREEYPHLLNIDNSDVHDNIELATRFLFRLIDSGKLRLVFKKDYNKRIAYHTPCHMARLGWSIYSTSLLRMIPGIEFIMLDSQCCGIAGTYGFKKENYATSQSIGAALFKQISEVNPDLVATDCETCKWQIEMSTIYKVMNPISIIADALDVEATRELNQL